MKESTPLERTQSVLDISVTERAAFKLCRRRWELEVLENLSPKTPPSFELEFGSGIHKALEAYYTAVTKLPLHDAPDMPLGEALLAWDKWYDETCTAVEEDTDLDSLIKEPAMDELLALGDLGEQILRGYDRYSENEDKFTIHAIEGIITPAGNSWLQKHLDEREFVGGVSRNGVAYHEPSGRLLVPIIHPKSQKPIKGGPVLSARIDLLTHRVDPGMKGLWVIDHKTTSSAPQDSGLDFDDQATAYCYSIYRWLGIVPRGICFNYLVKQVPKEPRILTNGNLSTAKDQLTTAEKYRQELINQGLMLKDGTVKSAKHAEAYEALLSHGWDRFFIRHYASRNLQELKQFEEHLFEEWQDMHDCWNGDLAIYPNLSKFHCPRCSVGPICKAMNDGSDWQSVMDTRYVQGPDRKATR